MSIDTRTALVGGTLGAAALGGLILGTVVVLFSPDEVEAMTAADNAAWTRINDDALPALNALQERVGDVERLRVEVAESKVRLADSEARLVKAEADLTAAMVGRAAKLATLTADLEELEDAPSDIKSSGQLVTVGELVVKGEVKVKTLKELDPDLAARVAAIKDVGGMP